MICVKCGKDIDFIPPILENIEAYGGYQTAVSRCCGVAYRVGRIIKYDVKLYEGDAKEDSWGNSISKLNLK